jgi:hypothetical protein
MISKETILQELRRSRVAIARDINAVSDEINIAAKLKRSVKARPLAWLGSAAALGYMLAGPKTRRVTSTTPKGTKSIPTVVPARSRWTVFFNSLLMIFKLLLPVLRPALSAYAAQRLGEFAAKNSR